MYEENNLHTLLNIYVLNQYSVIWSQQRCVIYCQDSEYVQITCLNYNHNSELVSWAKTGKFNGLLT